MIRNLKLVCAFGILYCIGSSIVYMFQEEIGLSIWFLIVCFMNLYAMVNVRKIIDPEDRQ